MKKKLNLLITFFLCVMFSFSQTINELNFTNAQSLEIIGRAFDVTSGPYGRLPVDLQSEYRSGLWQMGACTAGVGVRFSSDATVLGVKWTLTGNWTMDHMAATGQHGVDLYVLHEGKWRYLGTGRPTGLSSSAVLIEEMDDVEREYLLYLPLYAGVTNLEIGCNQSATISTPKQNILRSQKVMGEKPIVMYGTSILQGGCASRPGMAHTSIISRALQTEVINLGFSENAKCETAMMKTLQRIDAKSYVLDFMPNMFINVTNDIFTDSVTAFIAGLAADKPNAKIYIVEHQNSPVAAVVTAHKSTNQMYNNLLFAIYNRLKGTHANLVYIKSDGIIGLDGEGSVDGTHLTDLGYMRLAENLLKHLE